MHHQPNGAAFDIVLLLHVACVVVGLVTTATAAATAARLRHLLGSPRPLPEPLLRYFRPGVNWAGRTVYGIPVFGFVLIAMSQGADALGQGWVVGGLVLFGGVALVGEGLLWPAERRLQVVLAAEEDQRPTSDGPLDGFASSMSPRAVAMFDPAGRGNGAHGGATLTWRRERDPLGGPVLSVSVASPLQQRPVAQPQPRPPPTGGGSV